MNYSNFSLHAINDLVSIDNGLLLHRLPKNAREDLVRGPDVSTTNNGSEIRFFLLGKTKVTLTTQSKFAQVIVYYGDFQFSHHTIHQGEDVEICLDMIFHEHDLINLIKKKKRYHPYLVRLSLMETIIIKDIKGNYRLPQESEFPARKYLAYGTSITHGRKGITPDMTYPAIIGNELGYDVFNYGLAGNCFMETKVVDFLCEEKYDLITLCLSVNMLTKGYSIEEFQKRLDYLLNNLNKTNPKTPIYLLSITKNWRDIGLKRDTNEISKQEIYRKVLFEAAKRYPNIFYVDGSKVVDINNLTYDILHPANYGIIQIAYRMISILEKNSSIIDTI